MESSRSVCGAAPSLLVNLMFLIAGCAEGPGLIEPAVAAPGRGGDAIAEQLSVLERVEIRPERAVSHFGQNEIWSATRSGEIFFSADGGESWVEYPTPVVAPVEHMFFADGGRTAVIVSERGDWIRTEDGGESWDRANLKDRAGITEDYGWGGDYEHLSFDPALTNGVWVGYCEIMRTRDGGRTWTRHSQDLQDRGEVERCATDALLDAHGNLLLASVSTVGRFLTSGDYLYRSDDDGQSWREVCWMDVAALLTSDLGCQSKDQDTIPGWRAFADAGPANDAPLEDFTHLAYERIVLRGSFPIPPSLQKQIGAGTLERVPETGRVWYDDGWVLAFTDTMGESWTVVEASPGDAEAVDLTRDPDDGWAVRGGEIYRSVDGGRKWLPAAAAANRPDAPYAHDLWVDDRSGRVIVVDELGLRSLEQGAPDWTRVGAIDQALDRIVVTGDVIWGFGHDFHVVRSPDRGTTWARVPLVATEAEAYVHESGAVFCTVENCVLLHDGNQLTRFDIDGEVIRMDLNEAVEALLEDDEIVALRFAPGLRKGVLITVQGRVLTTGDGGTRWRRGERFEGEYHGLVESRHGAAAIVHGSSGRFLWVDQDAAVTAGEWPGVGGEADVDLLCWLDDKRVLLSVSNWNDDDGLESNVYLQTRDGGRSWQPGESRFGRGLCHLGGGFFDFSDGLYRLIAGGDESNRESEVAVRR